MNIFDKYIEQIIEECKSEQLSKLNKSAGEWEIVPRNAFLMEKETQVELGGYPKESINIIVPSMNMKELLEKNGLGEISDGVYCIGDSNLLKSKEKQISFGKIVLLWTEDVPDEKWYEFTQNELLTDSRIRLKDVMLRQSPTHYNINLRVGKKAIKDGFDFEVMGSTVSNSFRSMEYVKGVTVIFIVGESGLYKRLLLKAERIKEVTLTLNHIFDGINMDCGHCDLSEVCNEVEGIRALHKKYKG